MSKIELVGDVETPTADAAPLNIIAEEDALRLENVSLETDLLKAQAEILRAQSLLVEKRLAEVIARGNALGSVLRARYGIFEGDAVDFARRMIVRR